MTRQISLLKNQIADFCRKRQVVEFALFGSVLRDDFGPQSDVDVLVTFAPDSRYSLFDLAEMSEELGQVFGREVDLVEKQAIRNPFRRKAILESMEVVYAA